MIKIKFIGASGGDVTGSKHLLEFNGQKILLDCGMFQGRRSEAERKNVDLGFDPAELDAVLLSHAHIDHSGLLPLLTKNGFKGPIYCTYATRDLCNYMLYDSAYIQEREIEFLMKQKRYKSGKEKVPELLYSLDDTEEALKLFRSTAYEQSFVVGDGIVASFYDAGHILGSSLIHLILYDKTKKKYYKLCFTGDLGRRGLVILRDPQPIPETDFLISECTYGNRLHSALLTIEEDLAIIVNDVAKRGGKLVIPSFALERAQEVIYYLGLLREKNKIPDIPVYLDSPLAVNVSDVFRGHPECFDKDVYKHFLSEGKNPFDIPNLVYTRSVEDSKAINTKTGPMIIISASGMCEHGRILHHLKNNIENPNTVVLIVGYQAAHTLGRKLVEGENVVNIFGDPYSVKAQIYVMDAFSAHADRSDLLEYIGRIRGLKKIFLVHGEDKQRIAFKEALSQNGFKDVVLPDYKEEIIIDD